MNLSNFLEIEVDLPQCLMKTLFYLTIVTYLFTEESRVEFIAQGLGCLYWTWQPDQVLSPTTSKGKKISPPQNTPWTTVKSASKSGRPGFKSLLCIPEKRSTLMLGNSPEDRG